MGTKKFKKKLINKVYKSTSKFDAKVAQKLVDNKYYIAQSKNIKELEFIEGEKRRLSTPKSERITQLLDKFKLLGEKEACPAGKVLLGLYNKNKLAASSNTQVINTNLTSIIAKPEILMLAYKAIKGNKGALTKGATISTEDFNKLDSEQKEIYFKSFEFPDGMSLHYFLLISRLIRKGKYPWGSSSRIYIDKPGQPNKKRPITIPPFCDKLVQKAIDLVLQAIYEPYFEKLNRSFGFRPNKGCHDAIVALLKSPDTNGARLAIEGDIEAAYDTVDRDILIKILNKKISDNKFLGLLRERLNYDFVEKETNVRVKPTIGIPQGGIDSPYLFNIYMNELDIFVKEEVSKEIYKLNDKMVVDRKFSKLFNSLRARSKKLLRHQQGIKNTLKKLPLDKSNKKIITLKNILFNKIKLVRLSEHQRRFVSSADNTYRKIKFFYVRYADDWIILTNGSKEIANIIKEKISNFLNESLKLKLSPSKTLITDITRHSAKFLGFELRISGRGALRKLACKKVGYQKFTVSKKSGLLLFASPDRLRTINRFHTRGFCSENGFPTTVPWLSTLEAHAIVERFNSSIRGLAEYYLPVVRNKSKIHRWVYILRYSCLKTLAQKYKCSIKKIFQRFGYNLHSRSTQTVKVRVVQKVGDKEYYKDWVLLTYKDLINNSKKYSSRLEALEREFKDTERGKIGGYPLKKGRIPKVTNDDYLKSITWVSWRTAASINMPCTSCGSDEDVHQHHIKHVRKRAYSLIPDAQSYQRIMALRNRKQIPLCECCHLRLVHGGKYNGPRLVNLAPITKMLDNRIIHVESFVKPGREYHAKSLTEKGWSLHQTQNQNL